ncbi:MAG TPA: hypothetical protein VEI26_14350 [Terriglobales bacterium]|nr:hypothetical protein [Terriglobales bacterium]
MIATASRFYTVACRARYDRAVMQDWLGTRRLFVLLLAGGLFVLAARAATDPDVWWHLRTGQLIVQNHRLFYADPYSFTRAGYLWVDHEWLSQILIFGVYKSAGWGGLITGFAALVAATFLLVFARCSGRPYIAGAMTTWGAIAAVPSFGVRPQMFTLLLSCLSLFILERSYKRPPLLWWLLPLMLLWVNLHAGYPLGIVLIVVFLMGDLLDRALGNGEVTEWPTRLRSLSLAGLACAAIVPLNPYGAAMYRYPFETLHSRAMLAYIGEWSSPDFHQGRYAPALVMILATILLPTLCPRCLRARELLLLAVTMYAALRSVRHIPLYVLVAGPLLARVIEGILRQSGKLAPFERQMPLTRLKFTVNLVLLASFVVFVGMRVRYVIGRQAEITAKEFPSAAVAFLTNARPPAPIMNHYNWGGYFIWRLYPRYNVYIDGRADVYGDSFLDEFASAYYVKGESWRVGLGKWRVRTIVLPPDAPLVTALSLEPDWEAVFADNQAVVLTRSR